LVLIRKNLISSEPSSFQWLSLVLMEREHFNVMLHHSMELIQPQMLTKHASVTPRKSSSTSHLLVPLRLSGNHLYLNHNLKVNLRELLSTQVKS
jgi:hypothetical protein